MIKESKAYAKFKAKVKEQLTLDNSYVKHYKPSRLYETEEFDGERYEVSGHYLSDKEMTDYAVEGLLDDKQMLQEFITECLNPEVTELVREMIENIYMEK